MPQRPPAVRISWLKSPGCLQPGPTGKENLIHTADGTIWGVNETDMLMNKYVGQTVTIAGDRIAPTTSERKDGGASNYLKAMDVVVENQSCQK